MELLDENMIFLASLNGYDAFEIINEEQIDLILLDIMMPEIDGYEVCKRLKKNLKTKRYSNNIYNCKNRRRFY